MGDASLAISYKATTHSPRVVLFFCRTYDEIVDLRHVVHTQDRPQYHHVDIGAGGGRDAQMPKMFRCTTHPG
jgi:hypothetical protein